MVTSVGKLYGFSHILPLPTPVQFQLKHEYILPFSNIERGGADTYLVVITIIISRFCISFPTKIVQGCRSNLD